MQRRRWSLQTARSSPARCPLHKSKSSSRKPTPKRRSSRARRSRSASALSSRTRLGIEGSPMAILDFIKKQFIDIIEWTDDSRDTLSYRFPDDDREIKNGAQLIVRESQVAKFVYLGKFGDSFGPGKYSLTTDNIPILADRKRWKYGHEGPFQAA